MQVVAISSSRYPEWRWRILDYSGAILDESRDYFATISAAVAAGTEQLVRMSAPERADSSLLPPWRTRVGRNV